MTYYDDAETRYEDPGALEELHIRGEQVAAETTFMDEVRPMLPYLGKTRALAEDAKKVYAAGNQFRVIKPGARLEGIVTFGKVKAGYYEPLEVGDIITATGWREGMCGGGVMEANFATKKSPVTALWLQFWPMESLWSPWPMKSFVEPYNEETIRLEEEAKKLAIEEARLACCPVGMSCQDCDDF